MPRIPPPLVTLAFCALAWALSHNWPLGHFDFPWRHQVAVVTALCGLLLVLAAVREFSRARTTVNPIRIEQASTLVTSGPFTFSRNPMYLSMLLILAGVTIWLGSFSALLALPFFVAYVTRFQIVPEETALREIFGAGFADYTRRVRRWI